MQAFLKTFFNFRLLYVLFGGIVFYLVSISFDMIFIPMLEVQASGCIKWTEIKVGYRSHKRCVEFTALLVDSSLIPPTSFGMSLI